MIDEDPHEGGFMNQAKGHTQRSHDIIKKRTNPKISQIMTISVEVNAHTNTGTGKASHIHNAYVILIRDITWK